MNLEYYINQIQNRLGEGYSSIADRIMTTLINCINAQIRTGNYSEQDIQQFITSESIEIGISKLSNYEIEKEIVRILNVNPDVDSLNDFTINEVSFHKFQFIKNMALPENEIYYFIDRSFINFLNPSNKIFKINVRYIYFPKQSEWTLQTDLSGCSNGFMTDCSELAYKFIYNEELQ